jgi:phosphoribosylaminoimidazolecarboxamide formyltransferase/IMP cyclohydrolase
MADSLLMPRRALLSVHDKSGIVELARTLAGLGCELLSTGGTAALLRSEGLEVQDVSALTGYPELFGGRVKTLHPAVHGGLLARGDVPQDLEDARAQGIGLIDLVVVTLYPFEEVSKRPGVTLEELVENVDIGGPSMLRSAAKNHDRVAVLSHTDDYPVLLEALAAGGTGLELRRQLAIRAFSRTAGYDGLISRVLSEAFEGKDNATLDATPAVLSLTLARTRSLRYGENPHQPAAVYGDLAGTEVLHGKELSYNNLLDLDAALGLMRSFHGDPEALCAILKHTNPCGVGMADSAAASFERAFSCDTRSPFGGIVIWNRTVDLATAEAVHPHFMEVLIAPAFEPEALELLRRKKDRRLLTYTPGAQPFFDHKLHSFFGGLLAQGHDRGDHTPGNYRSVTKRRPFGPEFIDLLFAWSVCRHVKSNAIVVAKGGRTIGIGAGQMSRVDSCELAVGKARREGHDLKGAVLASDAFFPFPDAVEEAAAAGITAIIQPGGSVRDDEVIAAANAANIGMLFTGFRHFRH